MVKPSITLQVSRQVEMTFQEIPASDERGFLMGARGESDREEPPHRVVIPKKFYLATYPVTQAQFAVWTKLKKIQHKNEFAGHANHPAENMNWHEASDFCQWLTSLAKENIPNGYLASLPTEAHWEYACRAGTETEYYTGDGEAALKQAGWFGEQLGKGSTHPVGLKIPNQYGLHDMHGNVWEWCQDVYDAKAYRKRADGWTAQAWSLENAGDDADFWIEEDRRKGIPSRVLRGGSWIITARRCRSAARNWIGPVYRNRYDGFRVCLVPGPLADRRGAPTEQNREGKPDGTDGARKGLPDLAAASFPAKRAKKL